MVLLKIEAKFTQKRSKSRDRNFFRFLALKVFLTIFLLKKGGADKPPPISKRVTVNQTLSGDSVPLNYDLFRLRFGVHHPSSKAKTI